MTTVIEKEPQLIHCVDRDEARLPDFFSSKAIGVTVAEPEFMRAIELPLWSDYPLGWSMVDEVRGRSHDGKPEVAKLGEYWFIGRKGKDHEISETVALARRGYGGVTRCQGHTVPQLNAALAPIGELRDGNKVSPFHRPVPKLEAMPNRP